jgi:hypothetical protein
MSNQTNKPTLNNDPGHRAISDRFDKAMGWEGENKDKSCPRGIIHGLYHDHQGNKREGQGDHEGAKLERDRAQQQYNKCKK